MYFFHLASLKVKTQEKTADNRYTITEYVNWKKTKQRRIVIYG